MFFSLFPMCSYTFHPIAMTLKRIIVHEKVFEEGGVTHLVGEFQSEATRTWSGEETDRIPPFSVSRNDITM